MSNVADQFILQVRRALYDNQSPGFVELDEINGALSDLEASSEISSDVKAYVVQDLLDRTGRPRRRGGVPTDDSVRAALRAFVGRNDQGKPGLWLDPPKSSRDGVSSFVNQMRESTSTGSRITGSSMRRALESLEEADASDGLKASIAESLYRETDAQRDADKVPIDFDAKDAIEAFMEAHDPQRQGLGWFEEPR